MILLIKGQRRILLYSLQLPIHLKTGSLHAKATNNSNSSKNKKNKKGQIEEEETHHMRQKEC